MSCKVQVHWLYAIHSCGVGYVLADLFQGFGWLNEEQM